MILASIIFLLTSNLAMAYEKEIKSLSNSMAENIAKAGKKTIAVVDFTDLQGNVTELGRFLSEEFSVALAGAGKGFEVVERTHLKGILQEHKLSITGLIDPQTAKKLGQIAGVDAIITGSITPFGDSVRISVKILDTASAKVIGASSGDIAKTKAIEELLAKGIERDQAGEAAATQSTKTPPKGSKGAGYVWQDGVLRVTIESLKKSGKSVVINILYENISDKLIDIDFYSHRAHLLDEDGGRWVFNSDTAEMDTGRTIFPSKRIRSKMTFNANNAKDSDSGSIFDLFMESIPLSRRYKFNLTIQNIKTY